MDIFHIILTFNLGDYFYYNTLLLLKFHVKLEEKIVHFPLKLCIIFENSKILSFESKTILYFGSCPKIAGINCFFLETTPGSITEFPSTFT